MSGLTRLLRGRPISVGRDAMLGFWLSFSALWLITALLTHFFPTWTFLSDTPLFAAILVVSFGNALRSAWRPKKVVIHLPLSGARIEVLFGDIFACDGVVAFAVNEFFDSEIGQPVAAKSLHGFVIQKHLRGGSKAFDKQVGERLKHIDGDDVPRRIGKTRRYPIGTTALLSDDDRRFLAFALTRTDPETCKASANVPQMFAALDGLWQQARIDLNGNPLNVPLVGSFLAGVGLPAQVLLNMIVISFIDESKRKEIANLARIVLTWDKLDQVDLRAVKRVWEGV